MTIADISTKRIDQALDRLDGKGKLIEITDRDARLEAIRDDYVSQKNYKDTIIVTAQNQDRNELNQLIRNELKSQGKLSQKQYTFTVREPKNLSPEAKHFAQAYIKGDIVIPQTGVKGMAAGQEGMIFSIDSQKHEVRVSYQTRGGVIKNTAIDIKSHGQNLAIYTEKQQNFSQNDKVVFLKNDNSLNLKNGHTGIIKHIDETGRLVIKINDRDVNLNLSQYNFLDHGYAATAYKAQGQTAEKVIYHADSKSINFNEFYVAATRGKHDLKIYTDDKGELKAKSIEEQTKTSTLDYDKGRDFKTHEAGERQNKMKGQRKEIEFER